MHPVAVVLCRFGLDVHDICLRWRHEEGAAALLGLDQRLDEAEDEVDLAFDGVDDGQVTGHSVWAHEREKIREARNRSAEISLSRALIVLVPELLKAEAVLTVDLHGEEHSEHLESSRHDDSIRMDFPAAFRSHAVFGQLLHRIVRDELDILAVQAFEVACIHDLTLAADLMLRNQRIPVLLRRHAFDVALVLFNQALSNALAAFCLH